MKTKAGPLQERKKIERLSARKRKIVSSTALLGEFSIADAVRFDLHYNPWVLWIVIGILWSATVLQLQLVYMLLRPVFRHLNYPSSYRNPGVGIFLVEYGQSDSRISFEIPYSLPAFC